MTVRRTGRKTSAGVAVDEAAEMALLGSLIVAWAERPALYAEVRRTVRPGDFALAAHREIAAAVCHLVDAGVHPDLVALPAELRRRGTLGEVGGVKYLADLAECVPSSANAMHYASLVANAARLRTIQAAAHAAAERAADPGGDPARLAEGLRAVAVSVAAASASASASAGGEGAASGPADARPRAEVVALSDVRPRPVRFLWEGRLPLAKLSVLAGPPGNGKSFVTLDIAARVSTGSPWPDGRPGCGPGSVLILSAEDDPADTIRPRLDAAGGDPARVRHVPAVRDRGGRRRCPTLEDLPLVEEALDALPDARLVVVDPISAYYGAATDGNNNAELRGLLAPWADMAARRGVAVLAVTHLSKGGSGPAAAAAMNRVIGSIGLVGAARAAWLVSRDPADPRRRLMLSLKSNVAAEAPGLAYSLVPCGDTARVRWEADPVLLTADEALAASESASRFAPRDGGGGGGGGCDGDGGGPAVEDAAAWLRGLLSGGACKPVRDIESEAAAAGLSWRTVARAKERVGVVTVKGGFGAGWGWRIPGKSPEAESVG
jgi:hypothetical protein